MKLSKKEKLKIVERFKAGETLRELAEAYNVNQSTILWHAKKGPLAKKARVKKSVPEFVDIPMIPRNSSKVVVVITKPEDVSLIVESLWK